MKIIEIYEYGNGHYAVTIWLFSVYSNVIIKDVTT